MRAVGRPHPEFRHGRPGDHGQHRQLHLVRAVLGDPFIPVRASAPSAGQSYRARQFLNRLTWGSPGGPPRLRQLTQRARVLRTVGRDQPAQPSTSGPSNTRSGECFGVEAHDLERFAPVHSSAGPLAKEAALRLVEELMSRRRETTRYREAVAELRGVLDAQRSVMSGRRTSRSSMPVHELCRS